MVYFCEEELTCLMTIVKYKAMTYYDLPNNKLKFGSKKQIVLKNKELNRTSKYAIVF